jgi:hypothetical protein
VLLLESPYWRSQPQAGVDGELDGAVDGAGVAGAAAGVEGAAVSLVDDAVVEGVVLDEPPRLSVL